MLLVFLALNANNAFAVGRKRHLVISFPAGPEIHLFVKYLLMIADIERIIRAGVNVLSGGSGEVFITQTDKKFVAVIQHKQAVFELDALIVGFEKLASTVVIYPIKVIFNSAEKVVTNVEYRINLIFSRYDVIFGTGNGEAIQRGRCAFIWVYLRL